MKRKDVLKPSLMSLNTAIMNKLINIIIEMNSKKSIISTADLRTRFLSSIKALAKEMLSLSIHQ